jgi:aryl-alcohol dehydrogenase
LLVEVAVSGMCATDLHGRDAYYPTKFPKVFGHEGAGVVRAVGSAVTTCKPGDHVVMCYPWCGECPNCRTQRHTYCLHAGELKHGGTRADGSTLHSQNGNPVYSAFFQQSSFGNFTIANERFAVKVRKDVPLTSVCALACGGQTGAGAVFNVMEPRAGDNFAVFGVGAVGLSGLLAAKIAGCDPIIAVDVHERRLELAREFGATHTINHAGRTDVVAEIRKITGLGARLTLETSAIPAVFREAIDSLMPAGTCVFVGSARAGTEVSFETPFLQNGRTVRGVIQGDSVPQQFIPQLVDHIMAGRFPIERMITFYDLAHINRAATESSAGKTIKPVLRMPH